MKTVYPTKVSATLVLIISLIMGCILVPYAIKNLWVPFIIILLLHFLLLFMLANIKYVINESQLIIDQSLGKWGKEVIDISTIKSIEPTHTILGAPASSLDRLRISYNKYDDIIISPRRKEEFIRQLQSINPQIVFKEKK
ncbi:MAG: PH domain-containing protein [Prevotella sp.]|nr:PH domain-containing protein [Prevotella sp.]MBR6273243.1 PH domain-containing protein [Bacteroidales bacterium]